MDTLSKQVGIDVAAIERELTSLWKQAGEEGESSGVIRACLLNLIAYIPVESWSSELDDIITEITASHPCRAIVLVADYGSAQSSISAQVTSRCTLPTAAARQVCCEQVTITATGELVDEAPSAIVPLLVSDLPVFLWWRAAPDLSDRVFKYLVGVADRVVIDSAGFRDPYADLAALRATLSRGSRHAAFSDLNWARLTAWRGLIASFYDVARYRPLLDQLKGLTIEYSPLEANDTAVPARALLIAGWVASRLGWRLGSEAPARAGESTLFELTAGDRTVSLEFRRTQRNIEPGRLALVTLGTALAEAASFRVRRSSDGSRIETAVALEEEQAAQRVLSYDAWGEAALIGRELELLGRDRVYEQAVASAAELGEELQRLRA